MRVQFLFIDCDIACYPCLKGHAQDAISDLHVSGCVSGLLTSQLYLSALSVSEKYFIKSSLEDVAFPLAERLVS